MKKALMGLGAAALIATGSVAAVPQRAEAYPAWVIPAVIGAAFGGVIIGGIATQQAYAYGPGYGPGPTYPTRAGAIAVRPAAPGPGCTVVRQRMSDGTLRRVRVCN